MAVETWVEIHMILVTGATGYLGRKIAEKLGYSKIIGLSRTGQSSYAKHINCNIQDLTSDIIPDRISTIIHAAAEINRKSPSLVDTNVEGTKKIIEFALAKNVNHMIFISSSCTQVEKKNRYSLTKIKAEELIASSGIPYTIIRPNYIYGPGNTQFMSIVSMINKFKLIPMVGNGKFIVAPVHENDLIDAITACVENEKSYNKTYSICGEEISFNDFLHAIAESQNLNRRLLHISEKLVYLLTYFYDKEFIYSFQDRYGNHKPAADDLNFKPVDLKDGLIKSTT